MGKKSKKTKSTKTSSENDTVSILTPTVKSRESCLPILARSLSCQTFLSKIKEWIIVSADKPWNEEDFNSCVDKLRSILPTVEIKNVFVNEEKAIANNWDKVDNYEAIGYLRNVTNWLSTGDYMVCADDDDYYPPRRVEHAVTLLKNSNKLIAGCSGHFMYDADIKWVFQFKKLSNNHTVNNAMAFKREYLNQGNKYDSTKLHAEEASFLNTYKSDMIQLNPSYTVLQMIHCKNTYNKRQLLVGAAWAPPDKCNINCISKSPKGYIPESVLDEYRTALNYEDGKKSEYDIVYYAGWGSIPWSPYETKLGGSEQAIKHLVESWVSAGKKVAVYGDFSDETINLTKNDVNQGDYLSFKDFRVSEEYETIVLWRNYGSKPLLSWPLKAKKIFIDVHDIVPIPETAISNLDKVTNVIVRSKFHASMMANHHKNSGIESKLISIANGVRVKDFTPNGTVERDPYRFVWCSCYTRGLAQILSAMWPIIKNGEPRATFHIYYGMDQVRDEKFKNTMTQLLNQPGVIDHGRQSVDVVIKEKQMASYHLYYSLTKAETDCISIRESACAGCVPILSKHYVFAERSGIHLDGNPNSKDDLIKAAISILKFLKEGTTEIEEARNKLIGNEVDWNEIASKWPV